ncbi:hypothetical protein GCM10017673_51010 [Streptosporangium violaceochromogenes]|nr:hypothetical protein GCM10017673_51010 [Streptosporangium violaceochromogenes]
MTGEVPNVILVGGSARLSDDQRVHHVKSGLKKIKILCGNGYEHFVPTDRTVNVDGRSLTVYEWSGRTRIAE